MSVPAYIVVATPVSAPRQVPAREGFTVMELIREAGIEDLLAACGGACSCATCHVQVDPAQVSLLPAVAPEEEALLDALDTRTATSRLSCQLPFSAALSGLSVTVVPAE